MGKLDGKVAIVVGSATGIGAATVRLMAKEGADVVLADVNIRRAEIVAAEIREAGGQAFAWQTDISDEPAVRAMVTQTVDRYGGVDVLHNNAAALVLGVIDRDSATDAANLDLAVWDRTMAVNVRGFLVTMKYCIPEMLKRGGGSIINTSAAAALAPEPVRGAYGVSKAAVIALSQHIATAYGKRGIRCNAVAPGMTPNPDLGPATSAQQRLADMLLRHHLTPRLGRPEDIARVVVFLASDDAAFVTGQVISVDGGLNSHAPTFAEMQDITAQHGPDAATFRK